MLSFTVTKISPFYALRPPPGSTFSTTWMTRCIAAATIFRITIISEYIFASYFCACSPPPPPPPLDPELLWGKRVETRNVMLLEPLLKQQ